MGWIATPGKKHRVRNDDAAYSVIARSAFSDEAIQFWIICWIATPGKKHRVRNDAIY
jgi:hypothetical protein